jgi:hypothetical protein
MIRQQQLELQRLQAANPNNQAQSSAVDDSSAISERSGHGTPHASTSHVSIPHIPTGDSGSRPSSHRHPRSSFDLARADLQRRSRTPSRSGASPRLRSTSIGGNSEDWVLGGRDESAFYQAETQMLVRENQMLRHRIRELGKCNVKSWVLCFYLTFIRKTTDRSRNRLTGRSRAIPSLTIDKAFYSGRQRR